ncbi:MAG TPA: c-type cytochrome, partial [Blastocatellia bacterium]
MDKERVKQASACATIVLALGFLTAARTSADSSSNAYGLTAKVIVAQSGQDEKPVEQAFKNIQTLKGLPGSQLFSVMQFMAVSLGVRCDYCHVKTGNNWEWEKDDKQEKQTARKMIQMTADINKNNFGGRSGVSCATCHRGQAHPISTTAVSADAFQPRPQAAPAAAAPPEP